MVALLHRKQGNDDVFAEIHQLRRTLSGLVHLDRHPVSHSLVVLRRGDALDEMQVITKVVQRHGDSMNWVGDDI
ncbi:hypothetical protein DLE60_18025 [Micromonospora globispora]|nr:hypothetical protein DLE60_18025 [Micromonospora globispora]